MSKLPYTAEIVIVDGSGNKDNAYKIANSTAKYEILPIVFDVPTGLTLEYNGQERNVVDCLPPDIAKAVDTITGDASARDVRVGSGYTAFLKLADSKNYKWSNLSGAIGIVGSYLDCYCITAYLYARNIARVNQTKFVESVCKSCLRSLRLARIFTIQPLPSGTATS